MKTRALVLSTAVLLLAAAFRLWGLAELPPGLHSDEAFHLLNAQRVASGHDFPIYMAGNNGNEPLFAYLTAIPLLILGPITWAGRLTAAWAGLVGVAATIRLGNEMFPRRRIGWLAGAALAALFWHIIFSRIGLQGILAPAAAAATLAALWRGARTGSRWAFALAGVSFGLGLASYVAFRLFVFVALAAGLALLLAYPERRRSLLAGGAVAAASALLVTSPLTLFFIRYPEWFFLRYNQTTLLSADGAPRLLFENVLKAMGGLVIKGDQNWWDNLPGRPALDPIQTFFAGLASLGLARRWRQPEAPTLLAWLVFGLAPSILTDAAPHFGRTTMLMPALALLVALGLSSAWDWARRARWLRALIAAAGLLSLALTVNAYFGQWAHSGALWGAFETEEVDIGRALLAAPPGARLIIPNAPLNPYSIAYMAGRPAFGALETYYAVNCVVLPTPATEPATMALVNFQESSLLAELQQAYPAGTWNVDSARHDGQPYIGIFQIPAGQQPVAPTAVARSAAFGDFVRLAGYTLSADAPRPGGTLKLDLLWQIEQRTPTAYKYFVHLLGPAKADGSPLYAQQDSQPCGGSLPTTLWTASDQLAVSVTLDLPADLPLGTYTLQTGWYDAATGARAPVTADDGPQANDAAQLAVVTVGP